jgi:hypothetical protein
MGKLMKEKRVKVKDDEGEGGGADTEDAAEVAARVESRQR